MFDFKGAVPGAVGGGGGRSFSPPHSHVVVSKGEKHRHRPNRHTAPEYGAMEPFFSSVNNDLNTAPRAHARTPSFGGGSGARLGGGTAPALLSDRSAKHAHV